jgi:SSS family solute:Na+ symporter
VGGLLAAGVVLIYVSYGGLRGTSWVNTFQTLVFMILGAVAFVIIVRDLGGFRVAMERTASAHPDLFAYGHHVRPLQLLSYTLIPLSVGTFPHIFAHWLSARSVGAFKVPVVFYPLCLVVVWVPSVVLGLLGRLDAPDLVGPATNSILVRMIASHAPEVMAGLLGAGVFAAIMSSLDSQALSLSTMFTQDIVLHYRRRSGRDLTERQQVLVGRCFVALILGVAFAISLVARRNIFALAVWSFTGFAALLPIFLAALFWRRSTATGAYLALLGVVVSWIFFFVRGWGHPDYSVLESGLMPVAVVFAVSSAAMVAGSYLGRPPSAERIENFGLGRP